MRDSDLHGVVEIECEAYSFPWSERVFADCLRSGYSCWVTSVARSRLARASSPELLGYGVMQVGAGESHVLNLCIRKTAQGQGIGGLLLQHLLATSKDHRAVTALLEVRPTNRHALKLYERFGFSEVGVRSGYYPHRDGREDALVLARDLSTFSTEDSR